MPRLLIIGAGMATARLLQELNSYVHDFDITVIGEENLPCYNRILLSSVLNGEKRLEDINLLDSEFLSGQCRIKFITGERVEKIDGHNKTIRTASGNCHTWDKLIISTGSRPCLPNIAGIDNQSVLAFRDIRDLEQIRQQASISKSAVIIGGGLLGLEAANGLNGLGLEVTVVNRQHWIMPRQLDQQAADILQRQLETKGIHFSLGCTPDAILTDSLSNRTVLLSDNSILPCDMVLIAAGIEPNTAVVNGTDIKTDRGIIVDSHLATTVPDIYALGECCQLGQQLFGLVSPVYKQAETLAWNLCHESQKSYSYQDSPTHLKISGIHVITAGDFPDNEPSTAEHKSQTLSDKINGVYRRLICKGNALAGYQLVGDQRLSSWYSELLDSGQDISPFRQSMMFNRPNAMNTELTTTQEQVIL